MISKISISRSKLRFGGFEWIFVALIMVAIIDILIYYYFVPIESTFSDKIGILTMLAPFTSIAIAAIGISYQVEATKRREIQFRIHQQRKETYEEFLRVLEKLMKFTKQGEKDAVNKIEDDYRAIRPKLIIYASPEIISIYIDIIDPKKQKERDPILTVMKYAELYSKIRSEAGFTGEDVPTRRLVSLIITDINDPQYNGLFDERGFLK